MPTPATALTSAPTPATPIFTNQLLLAPAKELAIVEPTPTAAISPATIANKPPQPAIDYNQVLTVPELRRKAKAAGVKNAAKMRKNQLLAALAS